MDDAKLFLDRCIAQLDEGVILGNSVGTSTMYRWTNDAADLLFEIREWRRDAQKSAENK